MAATYGVTLSASLSLVSTASPVGQVETVQSVEVDWYSVQQTVGGSEQGVVSEEYSIYPLNYGVTKKYLNKCIDGTTNEWVYWKTTAIDSNGVQYPGTTFDASSYKVESVVYGRQGP